MVARKLSPFKFCKPDPRDYKYAHIMPLISLVGDPPDKDLRPEMPPIMDQGDEGSCGSNSYCSQQEFLYMKAGKPLVPLARNMHYYVARAFEGDPGQDGGQSIRDSMLVGLKTGVCAETLWPYTDGDMYNNPTHACYADAYHRKIQAFYNIGNEPELRHNIATGFVADFGIVVPKQLMDDNFNGIITSLSPSDMYLENGQPAGHALVFVGYEGDYYWVRNSWGLDWGLEGHFKIHKSIVADTNWVTDIYTARLGSQLIAQQPVAA